MRLLLALAALCAGVSATSQDSEVREVARVAADAIAHAATGSSAETPGRALGAGGGAAKERQPGHSAVTVGILLCPGLNGTEHTDLNCPDVCVRGARRSRHG